MSRLPSLGIKLSESTPRIIEEQLISRPLTGTDGSLKSGCRLGVLAFGDSITNGGGELQWGVALQSWALWLARGLGLGFTSYAQDGARANDVVNRQLPALAARSATPDARYDLGCLYIGVNDVRAVDWGPDRFAADFRAALKELSARCDRVLTVTAPNDLGRPRAGSARVAQLNAIVASEAESLGALLLDLRDFGARNHVMTDHVHPTALGQIAIAERALDVLAQAGLPARVRPQTLIEYQTTHWQRLRGDATYCYRHAKVSARASALRLAASRLPPSPHGDGAPAPG
jgi:lysophospholipase L1-like esterase